MNANFKKTFFVGTALAVGVLLGAVGVPAMALEEPAFESVKKEGDFEVRQYRGFIVAETFVSGDMDEASNAGFRAIADYIFGNNIEAGVKASATVGEKNNEKIAMTAPVTMEKTTTENTNEKIAMTAPVVMEKKPMEKTNTPSTAQYRVHFVMPSQYTMQTLPRPVNPKVMLREVAPQKMAVIRFSGFSTDEKVRVKTEALNEWIIKSGFKATGTPQFARYNPPITPPFMRRSEVMIAIQ